jgi:hypothetical protein
MKLLNLKKIQSYLFQCLNKECEDEDKFILSFLLLSTSTMSHLEIKTEKKDE